MPGWTNFSEVRCFAKPAVVSFKRPFTPEFPADNFYRSDRFLCEKRDEEPCLLWHFGSRGNEPLFIDCAANPLALSIQEETDSPAVLDVFTVDRSRDLWHRRFMPPPERSFFREGLAGCLTVVLAPSLLARFFPRVGWTSLGRCDSNPAACSRTNFAIVAAVRRGRQVYVRHFPPGRTGGTWDRDWILVPGSDSNVDPVVADWGGGVPRVFIVSPTGELYMHVATRPMGEGTSLGGGFAQQPPAVAGGTVIALAENGQLLYLRPDAGSDWRPVGDDTRRWSTAPVALHVQRGRLPHGGNPAAFLTGTQDFVFVRDGSRHIWTANLSLLSTDWTEWQDLDGAETSDFSVVRLTAGIDIWARGPGNDLSKTTYPL
jgi:hypothetical protein